MKVKTSELTGPALDWAVNQADVDGEEAGIEKGRLVLYRADSDGGNVKYSPSTDWSQGGPIIEEKRLNIEPFKDINGEQWCCDGRWDSPTPLIAAMRCYVASELGDEIDVPDEFMS